jgi:hypothetical protein
MPTLFLLLFHMYGCLTDRASEEKSSHDRLQAAHLLQSREIYLQQRHKMLPDLLLEEFHITDYVVLDAKLMRRFSSQYACLYRLQLCL